MYKPLLALVACLCAGAAHAQALAPDVGPTLNAPSELSGPAPALTQQWVQGPPDPNPSEPTHYRNDLDQPTQARLDDCWFFEAQAWNRPLADWRHTVAWLCKDLARKNASGRPLRDADQAMESLLLTYEGAARGQMAALLEGWEDDLAVIEQARPGSDPLLPHAAVLRSGWLNAPVWHDDLAAQLGLDAVLNSME